jgi:hypothetical protein
MTYPSTSADPNVRIAASNPTQAANNGAGLGWYYGRTRGEVVHDNQFIRNETVAAARAATDRFKPDAQPADRFWCVEADGVTRNLLSFATICSYTDGRWMMDSSEGVAYYLRGHPLPS